MKFKICAALFGALFIASGAGANYLEDNLRKDNWGGVDVVWLEDDSFPVYDVSIYFKAGAYTDRVGKYGETAAAFDLLTAGTERYSQSEILDSLEFYGASYEASVTHEFASYNVSGLAKDAVPTMKMVCHLFKNAVYPASETSKWIERRKSMLRNLPANHGALANLVFREHTLRGTGYEHPVAGNLKSLSAVRPGDLREKLEFFNKSVQKRIYIKGPKSVSKLKAVFENDCGWEKTANEVDLPKAAAKTRGGSAKKVYLVPVSGANQAQIRIGNFMTAKEAGRDHELRAFASQYIGGGFTSRLMQKVRVEKGLTYSIGAYASEQKNYGRKGISTFSKNETVVETLKTVAEVVKNASKEIKDEHFEMAKRKAAGSYLFDLESTSAFLSTLIYYDHIGRPYEEIYDFPEVVEGLGKEQTKKKIMELYDPADQKTLIVGSRKLKDSLAKAGYEVEILDYKDFL